MRITLIDGTRGRTALVPVTIESVEEAVRFASDNLMSLETLEAYLDRYEVQPLIWKAAPPFSDLDDAWWLETGEDRAPEEVYDAYCDADDWGTADVKLTVAIYAESWRARANILAYYLFRPSPLDTGAPGPHNPDPHGKEET